MRPQQRQQQQQREVRIDILVAAGARTRAQDGWPAGLAFAAAHARGDIHRVFIRRSTVLGADLIAPICHAVLAWVLRPRKIDPPIPRTARACVTLCGVVLIPFFLTDRICVCQATVRERIATALCPIVWRLPDWKTNLCRPLCVGESVALVPDTLYMV